MALIRLPAVIERTGLSRSSIYFFVSQGIFPKPIRIGERAVAWLSSEVDAVNKARVLAKSNLEIRALVSDLEAMRVSPGGDGV